VGQSLGPYRLEELLGEGGMGLVFRAVREGDGEVVALKLLKLELANDIVYRQRFVHEARSAAEVRHPNLVPVVEAGELDRRPFIAVAYVAGRTLEARLAEGALPVDEALRVADEVAAGLDALHEAGLVHRDVKAANVLLDGETGVARLTDFGLAKGRAYTVLTRPGQVLGTLDYLAPELIRGEPATPASDVYALGCLVYECVTGQTPFGGRPPLAIGMAHLGDEPAPPEAPGWPAASSAALLRALEKEPADRPASASDLARSLRAA
jgi:serine/threonine-protein kinase